jgi:hypothetical protein
MVTGPHDLDFKTRTTARRTTLRAEHTPFAATFAWSEM